MDRAELSQDAKRQLFDLALAQLTVNSYLRTSGARNLMQSQYTLIACVCIAEGLCRDNADFIRQLTYYSKTRDLQRRRRA